MAIPSAGWASFGNAHQMVPIRQGLPDLVVFHRIGGIVDGVKLDVSIFGAPSALGDQVVYVRFTAVSIQKRRGLVTIRCGDIPVYARTHLRVITGDDRFDESMLITASDPPRAAALFDENTRTVLRRFATRAFWIVDENGQLKMQWRDPAPAEETLDAALQVVLALCRVRTDAPYR